MSESETVPRKGRSTLLLLAALGFLPLFGAYFLFFFVPQFIPSGTTNQGTLITPPGTVAALGDAVAGIPEGKWTLFVFVDDACDASCGRAVYLARQVHIALGKDSDRVQRLMLVAGDRLPPMFEGVMEAEYPDMMIRYGAPTRAASGLPGAESEGNVYVSDPNGNIILYYTEEQGGDSMIKDLKHLLKLSKIG